MAQPTDENSEKKADAATLLSKEEIRKLRAVFRQLPLSDGFMFGEVMRVASICTRFLELLLGVSVDHVEYLSKEKDISDSFTGHGIRIDVYLRDEQGTVYSIEMDTSGAAKAYRLRIRYYQGTIDRNNLERGKDYVKLPNTFLIIISTEDFFGKGLAIYKRKMVLEGYQDAENDVNVEDIPYEDGTQLYILNADYTIANAPKEILCFLDCIRLNDTNPGHYDSPWMKNICARIEEVRANPAEEAYYMGLTVMMMDERRKGREEGAIINTVDIYRNEMDMDDQTIVNRLMEKFKLSYHDAAAYVNQRSA